MYDSRTGLSETKNLIDILVDFLATKLKKLVWHFKKKFAFCLLQGNFFHLLCKLKFYSSALISPIQFVEKNVLYLRQNRVNAHIAVLSIF